MALTNLGDLKAFLSIPSGDTTQDALLTLLIGQVSALIETSLGRKLSQATYTELYSGNGQPLLPLRQRPVQMPVVAGNLTSGSTAAAGLPTTVGLFASQAVLSPDVPQGATIAGALSPPSLTLSATATATANCVSLTDGAVVFTGNTTSGSAIVANVSSIAGLTVGDTITGAGIPAATTVSTITAGSFTLSAAATATGSAVPLTFGLAVWLDNAGYWGSSSTAFAASTLLAYGADYALKVDQADGSSKSGLVARLGGWWDRPFVRTYGLLSPLIGTGTGNIKVGYTAGYATIPMDLELACNLAVARVAGSAAYGQAVASKSYDGYSVSLLGGASKVAIFSPDVAAILANYRSLPV